MKADTLCADHVDADSNGMYYDFSGQINDKVRKLEGTGHTRHRINPSNP